MVTLSCMLLLFACHQRRARLIHEKADDRHQLKITGLSGGNYCGIEESVNIIVTSKEEWENLWRKVYKTTFPVPQLPDVDFSRETVLAAFMGTRSTGGFSIEIIRVTEYRGQFKAITKTISPAPGEMVSMALSQPFHIIKVDIPISNIEFVIE